jgi:hypothetical protein
VTRLRRWMNQPARWWFVVLAVLLYFAAVYAIGYGIIGLLTWCCT